LGTATVSFADYGMAVTTKYDDNLVRAASIDCSLGACVPERLRSLIRSTYETILQVTKIVLLDSFPIFGKFKNV
ncbi:MAG: hypothetical protein ACPGLY_08725, partial [Rubripirellula sp.]